MGREMQRVVTRHGTNDDFGVLQITFNTLDKNPGTSPLSLSLRRRLALLCPSSSCCHQELVLVWNLQVLKKDTEILKS